MRPMLSDSAKPSAQIAVNFGDLKRFENGFTRNDSGTIHSKLVRGCAVNCG
jgi:hypothetical protein